MTALMLMIFSYAAQFRYYINSDIYSAFNLGNLGEFGQKLNVSLLVAVFCTLGWTAGLITAFLFRKKNVNTVLLYLFSGLFAITALLFTPYNLQLLMPDTILQNIAMILCIAHIVFIFADMWLFSFTFCSGCKDLYLKSENEAFVIVPTIAVIAVILSYFANAYMWSFSICIAIYSTTLVVINLLHSVFSFESGKKSIEYPMPTKYDLIKLLMLTGCVTLLLVTLITGAHFITENNIAINY